MLLMRGSSALAVGCLCLSASLGSAAEWASISGRFVFGGDAPVAAVLNADKDVEVCGKHKLVSEELVVGTDKGVANVVVYIRDRKIDINPEVAAELKKEPAVLDNKGCRFEPHIVFVQTGQQLVVKNSDPIGHNSNIATVKNPPSNNLIPAGGDAALTFSNDEAIPAQVTCNIHPWMKAWLVVRDNPYAAVSKSDGSFEIKGVPVGEVELQIWQEKAGYVEDMTINGKSEKVRRGRMKVKVPAGGLDLGEITLAPGAFK